MEKLFSRAIIVFLQFFVCITVFSQNPVTWTKLKSTVVQSNSLVKQGNSIGYATSIEVLFGKTASNNHEGYLAYQVSDLAGMRKIGFANVDSDEPVLNAIDYYFDLQKQGVLLMRLNNQTLNSTYAVGDILKLSRESDKIRFYKNDQLLLEGKVNNSENLFVRAELKSNTSSISGVSVSFTTQRNEYARSIDYSTGTITLSTTNAQSNEFIWEDGEKGNVSRKFLQGHYPIEIKDQNGNSSFKEYSVGNLVSWTQFNNTTVTNNILSKNTNYQNNAWVSAKSSELLHPSDNVWLEYIIESQVDQKVIGFTKLTTPITNFTQIEAGFLISKDNQLQVIHEGRIIKNLEYNEKDRLLIEQKDNSLVWKLNDKEVHFQDQGITSDYYLVGLLRLNATLKNVQYVKNGYDPISSQWDDVNDRGSVLIDLNPISGINGPFRYIISESGMPSLLDIYPEINSQLYNGLLNQAEFVAGNDSNLTKTFSNLEMGVYFITVFDNIGFRIFQKEVNIRPEIAFDQQNGLQVQDNKIKSTIENASGSFKLFTLDGENSELRFTVTDTDQYQYFGLSEISKAITDYTSIDYGFRLEKTSLYTIVNGIKSNDYIVVKNGVDLSVIIKEHQLYLKLDNNPLFEGVLPIDVHLKGVIGGHIPKEIPVFPIKFIKKTYRINTRITNATCDLPFGSFRFSVIKLGWPTPAYSFNFTISQGPLVITTGSSLTNFNSILYSLAPGTYTFTVNFTSGIADTYSEQIYIGVETQWQDLNLYSLNPNTYSLERTSINPGNFSYARSENILIAGETGWIQFKPRFSNIGTFSSNILRLSNLNPTSLVPVAAEIARVNFFKTGSLRFISWTGPTPGLAPIPANSTIRFNITNSLSLYPNKIEIYVNGIFLNRFDRPANSILLRAHSDLQGGGFDNVITSFDCSPKQPLSTLDYTELKRQLDGGYTLAVEGKVKFTFDEEYDIITNKHLPIKIYDEGHNLLVQSDINGVITNENGSSSTEIVAQLYNFDDNRYQLTMSTINGITLNSFYYIEVETSTHEKRYLKILYKY